MIFLPLNNLGCSYNCISFFPRPKLASAAEAYSEPCQTSKMERFAKKVKASKLSTFFSKRYILDVWHCSNYAFEFYAFCSDPENKLFSNIHIWDLWSKCQHGHASWKFLKIWTILRPFLSTLLIQKSVHYSRKLILLYSEKLDRNKYHKN